MECGSIIITAEDSIQISELSDEENSFLEYFNNNIPTYSRDMYGYLKTIEYLYNLKTKSALENPTLSGTELLMESIKSLLKLLLKVGTK